MNTPGTKATMKYTVERPPLSLRLRELFITPKWLGITVLVLVLATGFPARLVLSLVENAPAEGGSNALVSSVVGALVSVLTIVTALATGAATLFVGFVLLPLLVVIVLPLLVQISLLKTAAALRRRQETTPPVAVELLRTWHGDHVDIRYNPSSATATVYDKQGRPVQHVRDRQGSGRTDF